MSARRRAAHATRRRGVGRIRRLLHRVASSDGPMGPETDLDRCCRCGDDTVVPVRWEQNGRAQWWIRLRCGSCGCFRETIASDEQVLAFDSLIHRRAQPIADAIAELDQARTARQARDMATPVELDLIDAGVFSGLRRRPVSRERPEP